MKKILALILLLSVGQSWGVEITNFKAAGTVVPIVVRVSADTPTPTFTITPTPTGTVSWGGTATFTPTPTNILVQTGNRYGESWNIVALPTPGASFSVTLGGIYSYHETGYSMSGLGGTTAITMRANCVNPSNVNCSNLYNLGNLSGNINATGVPASILNVRMPDAMTPTPGATVIISGWSCN